MIMSRRCCGVPITLLLILVGSLGLRAQEPERYEFKRVFPAKGAHLITTKKSTMTLNGEVTVGDYEPLPMTKRDDETEVWEREILEAGSQGVTRMKARLTRFEKRSRTGYAGEQAEETEEDARLDASFLVSLKDGKVQVTDLEGGEVDEEIRVAFEEDCADAVAQGRLFDCSFGFDRLLAGKKLAVGDRVELDDDFVGRMFRKRARDGSDPRWKVEKGELELLRTFTHLGRRCGEFKAKLRFDSKVAEGGLDMNLGFDLDGRVTVGLADCWVYGFEFSGPLELGGAGQKNGLTMGLQGKGKTGFSASLAAVTAN